MLEDTNTSKRILKTIAKALVLISKDGTCLESETDYDFWFLQEKYLKGNNINVFLPTRIKSDFIDQFNQVIENHENTIWNFDFSNNNRNYSFMCSMFPYDDNVLCQLTDITNQHKTLRKSPQMIQRVRNIQRLTQINLWSFNTWEDTFSFSGPLLNTVLKNGQNNSIDTFKKNILSKDLPIFNKFVDTLRQNELSKGIVIRLRTENDILHLHIFVFHKKNTKRGIEYEGFTQNVSDAYRNAYNINALTLAIDRVDEGIFATDEKGFLVFANEYYRNLHHIAQESNLNKYRLFDLYYNNGLSSQWEEHFNNTLSKGSDHFIINYSSPLNQSQLLSFEINQFVVKNEIGKKNIWYFSHNITNQLKYKSTFKTFTNVLNSTLDNLPTSLVIKEVDHNFCYFYRNKESFNRQKNINIDENAIGKTDFDYYSKEVAEKSKEEDLEIVKTGKPLMKIVEDKDKNGNLLILDKRKFIIKGDQYSSPLLVIIEWDITKHELMKRELKKAKEEAEKADKLKSAFLANMSHEIRTPLNAIMGFSQIISETDNKEDRKKYFKIIDTNNKHLLNLINDILDISKIDAGFIDFKEEDVDLNQLCQNVYDSFRLSIPNDIEYYCECPQKTIIIKSDFKRLLQVYTNMVSNALKFTKRGSVHMGYKKKDDCIEFYVTDTGIGISSENLEHVFDRFQKFNSSNPGAGLGTSISKTIIEKLGGTISVKSKLDKGSTFIFTLPLPKTQ